MRGTIPQLKAWGGREWWLSTTPTNIKNFSKKKIRNLLSIV
jgi:hypothetical protein